MFKFILSVILFSFISTAQANVRSIPFKQTIISFDENYFKSEDVEVIKVEQEYVVSTGGFGTYHKYGDYVVTLKILNRSYEKGFDIDHEIRKIKSARYVGSHQGYDLWEISTNIEAINFDLNIFMPAKLWNGTPTYGTPAGPTYFGPKYTISISRL